LKKRSRSPSAEFDSQGIRATWPGRWRWQKPNVQRLQWAATRQVFAYKKDCYSVDQIRLEFLADGQESLVVTESVACWRELVSHLPTLLPNLSAYDTWFRKVGTPPFEMNLTRLYERIPQETGPGNPKSS
jgi:hypothetical protein